MILSPSADAGDLALPASHVPDPADPWSSPYLVLTWDGSAPTARGTPRCVLGGESDGRGGRRPEGTFAEWHWDGRRLEVRTDRFGFQPLFYATHGTTLWLSSSIPELLRQGAPAELDDAAVAVFLRLGIYLADDTAFRAVRMVPPDARFTWEAGRLRVAGSRVERARQEITRDAAIDRYVELFRAAIAKHDFDPSRTIVPLTGGRDSRHILLELHATGRLPAECLTVRTAPPKHDQDAEVAAALAAAVGVPHRVFETTEVRHQEEIEKNWRTSLAVFEHFWVLGVMRHVAGRDVVIYDGIAGDTLSEAKYMSADRLARFRSRDVTRYAEEELHPEAYLPALMPAEMYRRLSRGLARERLEAELRTHLDAPNPVGSYRFWNRTRRGVAVAPFGLLATVATVRAPFLDHDLFDFLASLPAELLVDRTLHTATIARGYPAFASLPYENPAAPPRPAVTHLRQLGRAALRWEVGGTFARRGGTRVGPHLLRHGAYAARLAAMLATERRPKLAGLVGSGTYLGQLEALASGRRR